VSEMDVLRDFPTRDVMPAKAGTHDTSKRDDVVKADGAVDPCLRRGDSERDGSLAQIFHHVRHAGEGRHPRHADPRARAPPRQSLGLALRRRDAARVEGFRQSPHRSSVDRPSGADAVTWFVRPRRRRRPSFARRFFSSRAFDNSARASSISPRRTSRKRGSGVVTGGGPTTFMFGVSCAFEQVKGCGAAASGLVR
jgi:hypothetical protein